MFFSICILQPVAIQHISVMESVLRKCVHIFGQLFKILYLNLYFVHLANQFSLECTDMFWDTANKIIQICQERQR